MTISYDDYYTEQSGNGLTAYEGLQYQRGHGFFGTLFSNIIKPLTRYLGKQALKTGVRVGSDLISGENFKDSIKKNLKMTGNQLLDDGYSRARKFAQTGKGRKRRRRKAKKITKSKRKNKKSNKKTKTKKLKLVHKGKGKRKASKKSKRKCCRKRKKKNSRISDNFNLF